MLLAEIAELNALARGPDGHGGGGDRGHPGAVRLPLSQLGGVILAPGLGAQGAGPADVAARFAGCRPGTRAARAAHAGCCNQGPDPAACGDGARSLTRELAAAMG